MGSTCRRRKAIITLAVGGAAVATARNPRVRAAVRRARHRAGSRTLWAEGRFDGWAHRLILGGPEPDAPDDVVAERVRAALGPVTGRRDLPHVHVHVEHHVAVLHGDVGDQDDRAAIEAAVREVPGVAGIESHLHVGLLPSDSRPSSGRQPSAELTRLVDAARRHGGGDTTALVAVQAVLGSLAAMLPEHERVRLASHVAPDVAALLVPPRRLGDLRFVTGADQLVGLLAGTGLVAGAHAPTLVTHVLAELRRDVPADAADVARLLPEGVRPLWEAAG